MAPDAAEQYYLEQRALTKGIVNGARRLWGDLDPANLDGSWRSSVGNRMFGLVAAGQATAAGAADSYIDEVLDELGIDTASSGAVIPSSFAGVASDGRSLDTLLYEPVIRTKVASVTNRAEAMFSGEASLVRIVTTQLQDASRGSVAAGMTARPAVTGYVRMLNPPSCGRCAVLAGKKFKWNNGFQRHPHCDCRHIPVSENVADDLTTDPRAYFDSLTVEDQGKYFTDAGAAAIREGADIGQVVNARRGMNTAGATTREGTTRRGRAGRRTGRGERLTPEQILATARSRAEAVELLREHAYIA